MKEGYVLKADAAKYLTPEPITYEAMKRKSEKAAQTALEDAKTSILNAAGIGKVEAYCINTVLAELKRKGLSPEQEEYKRISRETARMVIRDRKGIWTRYYTDKEGLKDWLLWKLGLKKETVFDRMRKRSRQQYRMKERQSRNEFEICKAKRGHRADQRGIVGGLERETVPGTEVVASHSERRQQKQGGGGQTEADGSEGRCL